MSRAKRFLVGRPVDSKRVGETLLPKSLALPIFCSDPLSSVAYATDEILLVLALGGATWLARASWPAIGVGILLIIVVSSYRQTCYAYPNGGGAYAVSLKNLGRTPALIAASALMIDYVLTVAVSVVSGVANIVSAFPSLASHSVALSIGVVVLLTFANLRGVKESGKYFAIPTYGFVASIYLLFGVAIYRSLSGQHLRAESASLHLTSTMHPTGFFVVFLLLRAFASGCTALTGVEAISNGVPHFRPPKSRNAATTLVIMGGLAVTMFAGVTILAILTRVQLSHDPTHLGLSAGAVQQTVIAQLGGAVFGGNSALFYITQAFTAAILIMAANTAYNGFPILVSILGKDAFLPRQFARRGDRLVFSNGVLVLAGLAILLIWAFDANTNAIIQLYILGVFLSFTLSQAGMVRHWTRKLEGENDPRQHRRLIQKRLLNGVGASVTAIVLVVVTTTKFLHGAWIVTIAIPVLFFIMKGINHHYENTDRALAASAEPPTLPSRVIGLVLVSKLHKPAITALSYARAARPSSLTALRVQIEPGDSDNLMSEWDKAGIPVPLVILYSPFRDVTRPVIEYIRRIHRASPRDVICVYIPEYIVSHWWEQVLHNQTALRLKSRLLFLPGVMVTSVPIHIEAGKVVEPSMLEH